MSAELGVIGTGHLAAALVTGFCTAERPADGIVLSPRNAETAAGLAARFDSVRVAADNQEVVDSCDRVILAVRPQAAREVVDAITLRADQPVVSLMAPIEDDWLDAALAPGRLEARVLLLPAAERHAGPVAYQPPSEAVADLFGRVGTPVAVDEPAELLTLFAVSAWGAPIFMALSTAAGWAVDQGLDAETARAYAAGNLKAFADAAAADAAPPPDRLADQAQTPGGLNEQVMAQLTDAGWFDEIAAALADVRARLDG